MGMKTAVPIATKRRPKPIMNLWPRPDAAFCEIDSTAPSSLDEKPIHVAHSPPPPMATKMSGKGTTRMIHGMRRSRTDRAA